MDLSVIIGTRSRAPSLVRTLESLENQRLPDGLEHEVLIVDNGSTDDTSKVVEHFKEKNPQVYKYYNEPKQGKSNALNLGISITQILFFGYASERLVKMNHWKR